MEDLLIFYLQETKKLKKVRIKNWNVDGAECHVRYYANDKTEPTSCVINAWDMMIFINSEK